ncbi:16S rRNA processing protein RimM [candidate division KSB1 bacterium]|nr:16S rRNA processing protein RimM [candidate division KSB1 bacterium]RQW04715.1 MAG: 16S rRNA processing protein RimM [candidate division KSB1 bacterium]
MPPGPAKLDYVIVGRIIKPHGERGAVKVEAITDDPNRYTLLKYVFLGPEDQPGDIFQIISVEFQNKFVILTLDGINTRELADELRNQYLFIPVDQTMPLTDGSIYIYDLIGMEVYTKKGDYVGRVTDYQECPANGLFVVEYKKRELLLPDVPAIVKDVNLDSGRIVINPIEGLLD